MPTLSKISFEIEPVNPFRLDLTVWALRRRANNVVDRWDGKVYNRVLVLDGKVAEISITQRYQRSVLDDSKLHVEAVCTEFPQESETVLTNIFERIFGT